MVTFYSLFWQSDTPPCVCVCVCICVHTHPTSSLSTWVASCLGHCDWCCWEHWGAYICSHLWSGFFWIYAQEKIVGSCFCVFFWENTILFSTVAAPNYVPINITNFQKQTWIQIQASYLAMVRWVSEPLQFWDSFSSSMKLRLLQCLTGLRWEGNRVWYRHLEPSLHTAGLLFSRCQRPDLSSCSKSCLRESKVRWRGRGLGLLLPFIWSVVDCSAVLVPVYSSDSVVHLLLFSF